MFLQHLRIFSECLATSKSLLDGRSLWSRTFNAGSYYGTAKAIALDAFDRITIADNALAHGGVTDLGLGPIQSPSGLENFSLLAQYDSMGNPLFSRYVSVPTGVRGVAVRNDGHIFLQGYFWADFTVDGIPFQSVNPSDHFLVEFVTTPLNSESP